MHIIVILYSYNSSSDLGTKYRLDFNCDLWLI